MKERINDLTREIKELRNKKESIDEDIKFKQNDLMDTLKELDLSEWVDKEGNKFSIIAPKPTIAFNRKAFMERYKEKIEKYSNEIEDWDINKMIFTEEARTSFKETEKRPFLKVSYKKKEG